MKFWGGWTRSVGIVALLTGCYTLQPVRGPVPDVGTKVAFDVNDIGRVALGGSMGPEIAQVEGQLVQKDSSSYLVAVSVVRLLHGQEQVWTGEQVRLKSDQVGTAYERRFSLGRTIGLGVIGVGGFTAFLVTRSLIAGGSEDSKTPPDTSAASIARP